MSERNPFGGVVTHLTPADVKVGMANGTILLVDVRELNEVAAERIPGAANVPLSRLGVEPLPDPAGKRLVFSCRSGQRSQQALAAAQRAGLPFEEHMQGGIMAWKAAGFDIERG
ncbi:rhodanese-like domain-containing protein [Xanthobacter variabilis]|uniref:rhodanese-like domain-containing protein n=1 Tax=Xanthobacter variabilis TaxID=3119932 RepID=UPI0037280B30